MLVEHLDQFLRRHRLEIELGDDLDAVILPLYCNSRRNRASFLFRADEDEAAFVLQLARIRF